MWLRAVIRVSLLAMLLTATGHEPFRPHRSRADEPGAAKAVKVQRVKPRWQTGDRWIVETTTQQQQKRRELNGAEEPQTVRWQFQVGQTEKLSGRNCHKVKVRCLAKGRQPVTTLWVDCESMALRQLETQFPVRSGFRTVVESYDFPGNQPTPVLGPLSALPIDLPLFVGGNRKATGEFTYDAISGPAGAKAVGDVAFSFSVTQNVSTPDAKQVKSLVPEMFAKQLDNRPLLGVRLKSADNRQVDQIWKAGEPWPLYSNNGITTSRLVKTISAKAQDN